MTEFGDTEDAEIHARMTELADEFMVGWTQWAYIGSAGGQLLRDPAKGPRGDNIGQDMLSALVRPYPQVVAGTPQRFGFDRGARRFVLVFTTRLPDGRPARGRSTEVFVPRRHYGRRYRVQLTRAELIGGLDGQRLVLRSCPRARSVELTVTRGRSRNLLTCAEQPAGAGEGGPAAPSPPTGRRRRCPRGNSRSIRCSRTTLADGRRATLIVGTARPERLVGTRGRDVIVCGAGRDRVRARSGADRVRCGPGSDRIRAGSGSDRVFGGAGPDRADCGRGRDRAAAYGRDTIRRSCERRRRIS
jgi:hypothetical protein